MKKIIYITGLLFILLLFYKPKADDIKNNEKEIIYIVEITGEVLRPGIYEVPSGMTKEEVIDLAGTTKDSVYIEKDLIIKEDTTINVNKRIEEAFNLNEATYEQLDKIKGVGKVTITRILEYLAKNKFKSYEEFQTIVGVNKNVLLEIMCNTFIK